MKCGAMSWISLFFQAFLVGVALLVLLLKWSRERPRRKLHVLLLDTSKQLCSGSVLHCVNLFMAVFTISQRNSAAQELAAIKDRVFFDQCDWYFLSFVCDFLYTVPLTFFVYSRLDRAIAGRPGLGHLEAGCYYLRNGYIYWQAWAAQLVLWVLVSGSMKSSLTGLQWVFQDGLLRVSHSVLETSSPDPPVKSFFVFLLCPLVLNSLQIVIFDHALKKKSGLGKGVDSMVLQRHYTLVDKDSCSVI